MIDTANMIWALFLRRVAGEEIESESALVSADIQVLVFAVCGFGIDKSVEIISSLKKRRTVRQVWKKVCRERALAPPISPLHPR